MPNKGCSDIGTFAAHALVAVVAFENPAAGIGTEREVECTGHTWQFGFPKFFHDDHVRKVFVYMVWYRLWHAMRHAAPSSTTCYSHENQQTIIIGRFQPQVFPMFTGTTHVSDGLGAFPAKHRNLDNTSRPHLWCQSHCQHLEPI